MNIPHRLTQFAKCTSRGCLVLSCLSTSACTQPYPTDDSRTPPLESGPTDVSAVSADQFPNFVVHVPQEKAPTGHARRAGPEQMCVEVEHHRLRSELEQARETAESQLGELLDLYRRLHIELDDSGRSSLIVDLFHDARVEFRVLGFELVDRDLSSSTVLSPDVGESARKMLGDRSPLIRARAAGLVSRLVLPDAMLILTESLAKEHSPIAAEPMLSGIARWPNIKAREDVLNWFVREDAPFQAACNAAWSLEEAGLWDAQEHHPKLMKRLQHTDPKTLSETGMKLIARIGNADDLQILVTLLLTDRVDQQQWAANALVETPRAVEMLAQAAEGNARLFHAASDSLIRHRATPEGLRRLASLPSPDLNTRQDAIIRMGNALERDRLSEAVRLADLPSGLSVLLLNRLIVGSEGLTSRTAKGVIMLAELELANARPNRALEAVDAIAEIPLEPGDRTRVDTLRAQSLILLGRVDEAATLNPDVILWLDSLHSATTDDLKIRIAQYIQRTFADNLDEEQTKIVEQALAQSSSNPGFVDPKDE